MLEGVLSVDWESLTGAYGPARGVPDQLRALAATNAKGRSKLYEGFHILHQGDVYDSTAAAIPFLFEIARAPSVADRDEVVATLVFIASAKPPPPARSSKRVNPFTGEPVTLPSDKKHVEEMTRTVGLVRAALAAHVDDARALLDDVNPDVSANAALLLSRMLEARDAALPLVRAAALKRPSVRFFLALTRLGDRAPQAIACATEALESADANDRIGAAFFLAHAGANVPKAVAILGALAPGWSWEPEDLALVTESGQWSPKEALAPSR